MAEACNNIGKELTTISEQSTPTPRKSHSPTHTKRSLKRSALEARPSSATPPLKKSGHVSSLSSVPSSSSSSLRFGSLFLHHFNKRFSASNFDVAPSAFFSSSSPLFPPSSYSISSILSSPSPSPSFVCNWMDAALPDGFCGQRFATHLHLVEHLCVEHTLTRSSTTDS
jgi:hypothetical protein